MSDSKLYDEALDALYKAAKTSANFVELALTLEDIDFTPAYKERLKVALEVLKITWSNEDEEDEYDDDDEDDDELTYAPINN
ncbi:MAG: hypothetical protein AAF349_02520 [Cyanobacteria bacterium P01_A01_bin.68]